MLTLDMTRLIQCWHPMSAKDVPRAQVATERCNLLEHVPCAQVAVKSPEPFHAFRSPLSNANSPIMFHALRSP